MSTAVLPPPLPIPPIPPMPIMPPIPIMLIPPWRMAIFLFWNLSELTRSLPSGMACTSKFTNSSLSCELGSVPWGRSVV
eukprot:CAMPEP_0115084240 /NCGR_PEP_ID=MMETSP0227-20121206/21114_1 /TAXON_ID=89957 /ORGANISM="Polarella glacialis, Strain CCMP 1383" /LENGTH=78 /DNA_ID=CAMNT_0002472953 /DNA_START=55 /DNA_END=291 /DNA_ORIENTATION=-